MGEKGAVRSVNEEAQEPSDFCLRVLLKIWLDVYDEPSDCRREQADLYHCVIEWGLTKVHKTHKYKKDVQFGVAPVCSLLLLLI